LEKYLSNRLKFLIENFKSYQKIHGLTIINTSDGLVKHEEMEGVDGERGYLE